MEIHFLWFQLQSLHFDSHCLDWYFRGWEGYEWGQCLLEVNFPILEGRHPLTTLLPRAWDANQHHRKSRWVQFHWRKIHGKFLLFFCLLLWRNLNLRAILKCWQQQARWSATCHSATYMKWLGSLHDIGSCSLLDMHWANHRQRWRKHFAASLAQTRIHNRRSYRRSDLWRASAQ